RLPRFELAAHAPALPRQADHRHEQCAEQKQDGERGEGDQPLLCGCPRRQHLHSRQRQIAEADQRRYAEASDAVLRLEDLELVELELVALLVRVAIEQEKDEEYRGKACTEDEEDERP